MQTPSPASKVGTLPQSLQQLISRLEQETPTTPVQMRKILVESDIPEKDLMPWADFDHPAKDSYGRKMIYKGEQFEVMAMSWQPGDMSTIHDHGYTQWGAVKTYGPAEHAAFRVEDEILSTTSRKQFNAGDVVAVSHTFVHQMGNPTDEPFLSLHVYGDLEAIDNVTGDARLFDLRTDEIQRINGGVFFDLWEDEIARREPGPKGDFPTRLRHMVELAKRMRTAGADENRIQEVLGETFGPDQNERLLEFIKSIIDENNHTDNSLQWGILNQELRAAAALQADLQSEDEASSSDAFKHYAELYDAVICQPCMDHFMASYLKFLVKELDLNLKEHRMISIGCGTGLVEEFIQTELGMPREQMYGIDLSASMVEVARKRLKADVGNVLELDPALGTWSLVYSGLNVYQYLPPEDFAQAVQKTASIIEPDGYFIGDFITPDHIRWYPNFLTGADEKVISLRTPRLVEQQGRVFQESEITNISFLRGNMEVTYSGKHMRFLAPMNRIRQTFEAAFDGNVKLYDAVTCQEIPEWADTCESTRYVVVAKK